MGLDVTKKVLLDGANAAGATLHSLADIVNDLWGMSAEPVQSKQTPCTSVPERAQTPLPVPETRAAVVKKTYQPAFPPFEQLWKVADETVDWTEALVKAHPTDGLTSDNLWSFFHTHAEGVLRGDVDAYLEVLETANPLGDLRPYVKAFEIGTESADMLLCSFEAEPNYMKASTDETRRYLSGVSLRVARDLMALLPVRQVKVYAQHEGGNLLEVVYTREELQKVRFSFVNPIALTEGCGGVFKER